MDIHNMLRVHWACRRGMRELDVFFMPFFQSQYASLSDTEKTAFVDLLSFDDPVLLSWLMRQSIPEDAALASMIAQMQQFHAEQNLR